MNTSGTEPQRAVGGSELSVGLGDCINAFYLCYPKWQGLLGMEAWEDRGGKMTPEATQIAGANMIFYHFQRGWDAARKLTPNVKVTGA